MEDVRVGGRSGGCQGEWAEYKVLGWGYAWRMARMGGMVSELMKADFGKYTRETSRKSIEINPKLLSFTVNI